MIEVFARRKNSPGAAAFVKKLHAEGKHAREGNAALFDPAQIDRNVVMVYHDGDVAAIPANYVPLGIPCELIPGIVPETEPEPEPSPEYRAVNTSPGWWKVLDAEGDPVGPSCRSDTEAREAIRALIGGAN